MIGSVSRKAGKSRIMWNSFLFFSRLLLLSIATSIDALAAGISFAL
jgi:putative Mn2+ efflux pump MntP